MKTGRKEKKCRLSVTYVPARSIFISTPLASRTKVERWLRKPYSNLWPNGLTCHVVGPFKDYLAHWGPITDCPVHTTFRFGQITLVSSLPVRHKYRWAHGRLLRLTGVVVEVLEFNFFSLDWLPKISQAVGKCLIFTLAFDVWWNQTPPPERAVCMTCSAVGFWDTRSFGNTCGRRRGE